MIFELVTGFIFGIILSAVFPQFPQFVREALNKRKNLKPKEKNEYEFEKAY